MNKVSNGSNIISNHLDTICAGSPVNISFAQAAMECSGFIVARYNSIGK